MFEFSSPHGVQERDGFKQFLARVGLRWEAMLLAVLIPLVIAYTQAESGRSAGCDAAFDRRRSLSCGRRAQEPRRSLAPAAPRQRAVDSGGDSAVRCSGRC